MQEKPDLLATTLESLRPFANTTAKVTYDNPQVLFQSCLRSSFIKTFELMELSVRQDSDDAFFLVPALRGITEDMIFLFFLSNSPTEERELVIKNLMLLEVEDRLEKQSSFFKRFRPFQRTLRPGILGAQETGKAKENLRDFWRSNGWPNYDKGDPPPIREMAQKSAPGLLEIAYDFIYRFTSGAVHFQAGWLLRLGWGDSGQNATFSSRNMNGYYKAIVQIYGSLILCLYFELFADFFQNTQKEKDSVDELRKGLFLAHRWPEMITFEEMNLPTPKDDTYPEFMVRALYAVVMAEGIVSGAEEILRLNK